MDTNKLDIKNMKPIDMESLKDKEAKAKKPDKLAEDGIAGLKDVIERTKRESQQLLESNREKELNGDFDEEPTANELPDEDSEISSNFNPDDEKPYMPEVLKEEPKSKDVEVKSPIQEKFEEEDEKEPEDKNEEEDTDPSSIFNIDDKDFEDDDEDVDTEKQQIDLLKTTIKQKLKPITNVIDLSSFTVSKTSITASNALNSASSVHAIDWVLPATGVSITMRDFGADEIEGLNPSSSSQNLYDTYVRIYKTIYDHIIFHVSKKPTFWQWIKTINIYDVDHLYFAIFMASFEKSNLVPYTCSHCKNVFMKEKKIEDMIKYKNDKVKIATEKLRNTTNFNPTKYKVQRVQISETLVADLKQPSIYDVTISNNRLDDEFRSKYSRVLNFIAYIDELFIIDTASHQLIPIEINTYKDKPIKTLKQKVRKYAAMLATLNSDQYFFLNSYIKAITDQHSNITYVIPSETCPKCHTVIPEMEQAADYLLFTRHRMMALSQL